MSKVTKLEQQNKALKQQLRAQKDNNNGDTNDSNSPKATRTPKGQASVAWVCANPDCLTPHRNADCPKCRICKTPRVPTSTSTPTAPTSTKTEVGPTQLPGEYMPEPAVTPTSQSPPASLPKEQEDAIRSFKHPVMKVGSLKDNKHISNTLEQMGVLTAANNTSVPKCAKATEEAEKAALAHQSLVMIYGPEHPMVKHAKTELEKAQQKAGHVAQVLNQKQLLDLELQLLKFQTARTADQDRVRTSEQNHLDALKAAVTAQEQYMANMDTNFGREEALIKDALKTVSEHKQQLETMKPTAMDTDTPHTTSPTQATQAPQQPPTAPAGGNTTAFMQFLATLGLPQEQTQLIQDAAAAQFAPTGTVPSNFGPAPQTSSLTAAREHPYMDAGEAAWENA